MNLDWANEWHKKHGECFWTKKLNEKGMTNEGYWDSRSDEIYAAHDKITNYPGAILEKMIPFLAPEAKVLDIGAGSGAYSVPFAKISREVTVVEPSKGQLRRLAQKARGLENIKIVNKRWEEVNREELEEYDLVNAAYCFSMPDIKEALGKMISCTKNVLFLVAFAGSSLTPVLASIIPGYNPSPDYIYLYNLLYQMDIKANVEIITRRYLYPWGLLQKLWAEDYDLAPDEKESALAFFQKNNLIVSRDGAMLIKCWYRDAVIWFQRG
ncbi:MAG: class I SAM-dependent methyltransferase [Peptococcaceae bacterium]|nr:class I SAM-dependent methyltransferase [Peptococcaceae bacterium]